MRLRKLCFQGWQFVFCHELIEQLQADKQYSENRTFSVEMDKSGNR